MAYFAQIDNTNTVIQVISVANSVCGEPELQYPDTEPLGQAFIADTLQLEGTWLQTSYNNKFRGTYAGPGYTYDSTTDTFIPPAAEEEPDENERSN